MTGYHAYFTYPYGDGFVGVYTERDVLVWQKRLREQRGLRGYHTDPTRTDGWVFEANRRHILPGRRATPKLKRVPISALKPYNDEGPLRVHTNPFTDAMAHLRAFGG